MKKISKFTLAGIFSILIFLSGCDFLDSVASLSYSNSGYIVSASGSKEESYSSSSLPNIIEVPARTATVKISNLPSGKTLWLSKTNPTETLISSKYTRYVNSGSGISLETGNVSESSTTNVFNWLSGNHTASPCVSASLNRKFNENMRSALSSARTVSITEPSKTVTQITPEVGSTKKMIYVDTNSSMSTYAPKNAILRAVGTSCYVWVIDDNGKYWTDSSSPSENGQQINSAIAKSIADNFDKLYPMVRAVFGYESDDMIVQSGGSLNIVKKAVNAYSDTGSMVNIVVYDIANDYSKGQTGGTVGYFYAKDYYYNYNYSAAAFSNAGKYFYIDAYFTANSTAMVYSTLAHEFQHMIDFGVKTLATDGNLSSGAWYNEMKSMLCEDIMNKYLVDNNKDFTTEDGPFDRLPMFCRHYYDTGLEWRDNDDYNVYYSYANNYAFGAWAARNYGGISFINKIASNNSVDIVSIEAASGSSITEMLKNYTAACLLDSPKYGFNKDLSQTSFVSNGYYYPMLAVDLWDLSEILPEFYQIHNQQVPKGISTYYSVVGPVYFGYNSQQDLRPYGFTLSKIGVANSTVVTLNFNTTDIDDAQKTYIIIE